MPHISHCK